jgi:hypothetical protein
MMAYVPGARSATFVRGLRNVRKVETVGIEPTSAIA